MGKSSKQETTQESKPPKWAQPLLERGAGDAMKLYEAGKGFNTYTGPTLAGLSAPTLSGMNNMLAATGYTGAPVSNQSINANIPNVQAIMQQALANKPKPAMAQSNSLWGGAAPQEGPNEKRLREIYEKRNGEGSWAAKKQKDQDAQYAPKTWRTGGR